ncbi:MAG: hypothetical protein ACR2PL_28425 [Dehalococcoidia bacterium]
MSFLDKFLHHAPAAAATEAPVECLHGVVLPRWGSVADMGHEDKATSYHCDACGKDFMPEEARAVRATEAERLHTLLESRSSN